MFVFAASFPERQHPTSLSNLLMEKEVTSSWPPRTHRRLEIKTWVSRSQIQPLDPPNSIFFSAGILLLVSLLPAFEMCFVAHPWECAASGRGRAGINLRSFPALFIYMTLKMMSVHNVEHDGGKLTGQ